MGLGLIIRNCVGVWNIAVMESSKASYRMLGYARFRDDSFLLACDTPVFIRMIKFLLTLLKGKGRINIDVDKVNVDKGFSM